MALKPSAVSLTLLLLVSCRQSHLSLSLPAKPSLPYLYSQADYACDVAVYENSSRMPDAANQEVARLARNNICWGLMGTVDEIYSEYSAALFAGKGGIAVAGDAATIGLTAAGAIANRVAMKTIFGILGTAVAGVNLSVDKNFFAQQSYQIIAMAMDTRRTAIYGDIVDGLSRSVADYPLPEAKRDIVQYLYAGSLPGGLQEIQREAGAASAERHAGRRTTGPR